MDEIEEKAVRADVDAEAGWYAHMISDQMIARMIDVVSTAFDKAAPPKAQP